MSELGCDYAGTKYELKLDDEGKELLQRAMEGEACGEEISVIYVDDDIEDEVDACWLAGVMKDFDACRRILAHDRTTSKEMMHDLVVKAFEANDTELMSRILSSLPTKHAVYKIDPEILFEDRFSEDLIEFCIESGFRCDSLQGVAPCASRKCLLYCKATMHIPVSPYSTEPISEGTTLCEADLFLMRMLINGAVSVPIYQAALAVRSNLKPATSLTWVGHFIYAASLNKNDDFWRATVRTTAFWDYASERGVSKNELLTVKSGKPITYPSRLRWIMVEIFPTVSELRKARVIEFVTEEQAKVTTTVAASVLIDPVAQGIDMILGTPTANSTPSAAQKALDLDPFAAAVEKSSSLISVSTSSKLQLYSYYKQATEGDCTIPKPGMFEMEKKAKWDAWTGVTGLSKEDAKTKYINLVNSMQPVMQDNDYWPLDKRLKAYWNSLWNTTYAAGASWVKLRNLVGQKRDQSEGEDFSDTTGHLVGQVPPPLVLLEPRGSQTVDRFSITSDQLLGGHSEAFLDVTEGDNLLFHGTLRVTRDPVKMATHMGEDVITDDYVGYASFECFFSKLHNYYLHNVRGVEIRCRGSQTPFTLKYQTRIMPPSQHLAHMFVPTDEWRCYVLRFDHMRLLHFGTEMPSNRQLADNGDWQMPVRKFMISVNVGEEDDFWLEIDYIRYVNRTEGMTEGKGETLINTEHDRFG